MIRLVHPKKEIIQAVEASLRAVWPDVPLTENGPIELVISAPPRRLGDFVREIQQIQRQHQWPVTLGISHAELNTRTREWLNPAVSTDPVLLTEKEVAVLLYLWQGRIATREDLLRDVWQYAQDADTHTIETHIYRLRQKIEIDPAEPQFLITSKDGYQLAATISA